jgi:hypothetical protein
MLPSLPTSQPFESGAARHDLVLWTTKDGREIPLDDMTCDHISNAVRVLTLWRSRAKKKDSGDPVVRELGDALDQFKRIQRQRRKSMDRDDAASGVEKKRGGFGRR